MSLVHDVRLAIRHLRLSPGHAIAAALTLALAIGANSAIFSAVHAVLLRPLPVEHPETLAVAWQTDEGGQAVVELTYRHLREWSRDASLFTAASVMASHNWSAVLEGRGEPSRIWFAGVSAGFFETLGVKPLYGRTILREDDVPNGPGVAVLNYDAWMRRFGGDPNVVGTSMTLDGSPLQIVGVMPAGVDFPRGAEFWTPGVPIIVRGMARGIVALAPDDLPRLADISMNGTVALFTFGIVLVTALLTSAMPMRDAGAVNLVEALDGSRATSSRRSLRARSALLVVQIGLAVVLLVATGLVVRSFMALRQVDLGFTPDRVLTAIVRPRGAGVPPNRWLNDFLGRVRAMPGVEAAGAVYLRPLMLGPIGQGVRVFLEGQPETRQAADANPTLNHQIATPGYFEAMNIRLARGRFFTDRDTADVPRVAIVSEATARRLWPGQDPIGRKLMMATFTPGGPPRAWRTVVGVVRDVRYRGIDEVQLDVYDPALQVGRPADNVVVRTAGDPQAAAAALRALAREMDARAIVDGVTSMDAVVGRAQAPWRLSVSLFLLFGVLAFGLAALGLFGLVALDVAHRAREFAVRLALGASRGAILRSVLARAGRRVAAGLTAGVLIAVLVTRTMRSLLFEVAPGDVTTYASVLAIVLIVVAVAAYLPARRAVRADPRTLLKQS